MSRILITGAAGFVGSHTVELAAQRNHSITAIDNFNHYYDPTIKHSNAALLKQKFDVKVLHVDLANDQLTDLLDKIDVVIHLAGQPGVRESWSTFHTYVKDNIQATERLLAGCREVGVQRIIYASSSSVYGNAQTFPISEEHATIPYSPYGVTKLAGEHLVRAFGANFGIEFACLRYFTVYGPRQRPDMAFARLINSSLSGQPFVLHGSGMQVRDFTFVGDVARANLLAAESNQPISLIANIAGGTACSMNEVVELIGATAGSEPSIIRSEHVAGDVYRTGALIEVANRELNWMPEVRLIEGLRLQYEHTRCSTSE